MPTLPTPKTPARFGSREVLVTSAAAIRPQAVRWLWEPFVPLGKVTILAGRPGLGKSLLSLDVAAQVTIGGLQGDITHDLGDVLIASAEDDPEDTLVPRLAAAGADLNRVGFLDVRERHDEHEEPVPGVVSLPGDAAAIADAVAERGAKLVVVDPVSAFLDRNHSAYSNQEVRLALAPLATLARDLDCAVLAITHLNKQAGSDPLVRIADSGAFTALARSVLLLGEDNEGDEEDGRRVLSIAKSNLSPPGAEGRTLEVATERVEVADGVTISAPVIRVTGRTRASADDLLKSRDERSAIGEAKEFLREFLADGAHERREVVAAAKAADISERTLTRAKGALGVRSERPGGKGPWFWRLPSAPPTGSVGSLGSLGALEGDQEGQGGQGGQAAPGGWTDEAVEEFIGRVTREFPGSYEVAS